MINYLLNYIEDYQIDYLKEQFTEEIIELLEIKKEQVIYKIEQILKQDSEADIYSELSENTDDFI